MKIYSEKIGPVEYFDAIGFVCFSLPYAWRVPQLWQVCIVFTIAAIYWLHRLVKKEEVALRLAKQGDGTIAKIVITFGAAFIVNAMLIRFL